MLNLLALVLLFVGASLVVVGYSKLSVRCPPTKIEYRYIPRTFKEEQEAPVLPSDIFAGMFKDPTPYSGGYSLGKLGPIRGDEGYIRQG